MIQTTLFDQTYPAYPAARRTDTSREAAAAIAPRAKILREKVFSLLLQRPMSADQCAIELNESPLAIRPRVAELNKMARIRDTGERAVNASGKRAIVWAAAFRDEGE